MSSRRCAQCDSNWPNTDAFRTCPECGRQTWLSCVDRPNKTVGLPRSERRKLTQAEIEREVQRFKTWLETVGPDDFTRSL